MPTPSRRVGRKVAASTQRSRRVLSRMRSWSISPSTPAVTTAARTASGRGASTAPAATSTNATTPLAKTFAQREVAPARALTAVRERPPETG